jgi:hypothetical protein
MEQELSNCFLSERPGYVCPFAHDIVELEIIDYIKRKLKRRHVAAGGGGCAALSPLLYLLL